jgi:hypothetical protein
MANLFTSKRSFLVGLVSCATFSLPAHAHRQKKAQTSIDWNQNTKSLEVTHMLHLHDAEQALAHIGKLDRPDLTSLSARATLALYASQKFKLSDLSGRELVLDIIGAEIESRHIFIYQERKFRSAPKGLMIENQLLQDAYPDQINHVNVTLSGDVRTVIFAKGDKAKKVLA